MIVRRPPKTEYDLAKRRIVHTSEWFDDGYEVPWIYVRRTGTGHFEAIINDLVDDEAHERSLGTFDNEQGAVAACEQAAKTAIENWLFNKGDSK